MAPARAQVAAAASIPWQQTAAAMHAALDDADAHARLWDGEALGRAHAQLAALGRDLAEQSPPRHEVERLRSHLSQHRTVVVSLSRRLTTILAATGAGDLHPYGPEGSLRRDGAPGFLASRA